MAYSRAYAEGYADIDWSANKKVPLYVGVDERNAKLQTDTRDKAQRFGSATYVMPDIAPFVSPVDFSVISSRSQLREHERKHKVRQCGELKNASDFDNTKLFPQQTNEKALEAAYRVAVEKHWRD